MSRTLEEETLYQLIAFFLLIGVPPIGFFLSLKLGAESAERKALEESDRKYLQEHGQAAYDELLRQRAANKPGVLAAAATNPLAGQWQTRSIISVENLLALIEQNHPEALIGTPPHRLAALYRSGAGQLTMSGAWAYPKVPQISTSVSLELAVRPLADGRCSVTYKYKIDPSDDPFAKQIVEITNFWLKNLLQKARQ